MNKESKPYLRKEKILITDIMYDVLNSRLLQRIYGTEDPAEIVTKILEEHIIKKIKQGDFEGLPGNEEIYQAFNVRPEPKNKKSS